MQHPSALPELPLISLAFRSELAPFVKGYHHLMKQLGPDSLNMLLCSLQASAPATKPNYTTTFLSAQPLLSQIECPKNKIHFVCEASSSQVMSVP